MYGNNLHKYIFPYWHRFIIHTSICKKGRPISKVQNRGISGLYKNSLVFSKMFFFQKKGKHYSPKYPCSYLIFSNMIWNRSDFLQLKSVEEYMLKNMFPFHGTQWCRNTLTWASISHRCIISEITRKSSCVNARRVVSTPSVVLTGYPPGRVPTLSWPGQVGGYRGDTQLG